MSDLRPRRLKHLWPVVSCERMKPEPSIFDDVNAEADDAADAEGLADLDAGRVVTHDRMKAWLLSWGTSDELPPPSEGH